MIKDSEETTILIFHFEEVLGVRYKAGDLVRWMLPLEPEYSYGFIKSIDKQYVKVEETGYYSGKIIELHLRNLELVKRGGRSGGGKVKKYH